MLIKKRANEYKSYIQETINYVCYGLTLDVACGNKRFNSIFSSETIRVDINKKLNPQIVADIRYLPFKENTFDSVYCIQTIGCFYGSDKAFSELNYVMKVRGKVVITLLRKYALYRLQIFRNNKGKERFTNTMLSNLPFLLFNIIKIDAFFPILKNEYCIIGIKYQ